MIEAPTAAAELVILCVPVPLPIAWAGPLLDIPGSTWKNVTAVDPEFATSHQGEAPALMSSVQPGASVLETPTAAAVLVILRAPVRLPIALAGPLLDIPGSTWETVTAVDPEFATCYQAEAPALIAFLITCGANPHDAADAAQEAFLELFKQWGKVYKPKQWLRKVAFRIFLRQPVRNISPPAEDRDVPSPLNEPANFDFREEEQLVLDVLRLLPTAQRSVLALHYDQFGTSDISEILRMKQATVRKNLERARATLKKLLDLQDGQLRISHEPSEGGGVKR